MQWNFVDRIARQIGRIRRAGVRPSSVPRSQNAAFPPDFDEQTIETIEAVQSFTMTSPERIASLCEAVRHCVRHEIPGSFVECGVWKGGSMMAVARTLIALEADDRHLYLYDTFDGMTTPTTHDQNYRGQAADDLMKQGDKSKDWIWAYSPQDNVREAMRSTGYDMSRVHLVAGRVEDTLPEQAPSEIACLRLDTDWYESTRHELTELYPRLSNQGVLIVDDYGHWAGSRRAVDEYIERNSLSLFLHRIDYTGRIAIKT